MSCPLLYVLVLLNLLRRPALLLGEASRRAIRSPSPPSACLPRALSPLFPPLCSSGGTAWRWACVGCLRLRMSYGCHTDVVLMSCGYGSAVRLRPACLSPRFSTRVAGRGATGCRRCLLLSDFYRLPLSLAGGADGAGLLAYSYVIGRISPAVRGFCGSREL